MSMTSVFPNMTYAAVHRSIHANAKINAIDTSEAEAAPGVIAVLTGEDYASDGMGTINCETVNPMILRGRLVCARIPHWCGGKLNASVPLWP